MSAVHCLTVFQLKLQMVKMPGELESGEAGRE